LYAVSILTVRIREDPDRRYALRLHEHQGANKWIVAAGPFIDDEAQAAANRVKALLDARPA